MTVAEIDSDVWHVRAGSPQEASHGLTRVQVVRSFFGSHFELLWGLSSWLKGQLGGWEIQTPRAEPGG